jgi:hypothetical protein
MQGEHEELRRNRFELDRQAWNLPRPYEAPQMPQPQVSVQPEHEDKQEADPQAA